MSGKICVDELERVKRVARTDCIRTPKFFSDMKRYKDRLYKIGVCNGILGPNRPKIAKLAMMGTPRSFVDDIHYDYRPRQTDRSMEPPVSNRGVYASNSISPSKKQYYAPNHKGIMDFNGYTTGRGDYSNRGDYQANENFDFNYATSNSGETTTSSSSTDPATTSRSVKPVYTKEGRINKRPLNETPLAGANHSSLPYDLNNAYPGGKISPKAKFRTYEQDEINSYITKEIEANSKQPVNYKPKAVSNHDNSSLCVLL